MDWDKMREAMKPQSNEFDAVAALAKAYKDLPAIVDDDYPRMRHVYEGKVRELVEALIANGRVPVLREDAIADLKSHREAWSVPIKVMIALNAVIGDSPNKSYYEHELEAFNRAFDALTK